jgi:short-subunit dehydrogenase involved in D-alanine esterification of teichoic acids
MEVYEEIMKKIKEKHPSINKIINKSEIATINIVLPSEKI